MRSSLWVWWVWVALVLAPGFLAPAWAQTMGNLRVVVIDQDEIPIPGVRVSLSGETLIGGIQERFSDGNGEVLFTDLPPGQYRIVASDSRFAGVTVEGVQVNINRTTVQQIRLTAGEVEEISVSSRRPAVEVESTSTGMVLTKDFLQSVPAGRSYQSSPSRPPRNSPNMAGSAYNENTYMLDGANITGNPNMGGAAGVNAVSAADTMLAVLATDPATLEAPPEQPPESRPEQPPARKVHHHGAASLRAPRPAETLDAIGKLATDAGGSVDHMDAQSIHVRVPVAEFERVWDAVLELGDVLDQRVQADDITEEYAAYALRVRSLQRTLDRLVLLLAQSKSEAERVSLLDEIARVTEALDLARTQLRTLADLAAMSRIGVTVVQNDGLRMAVGSVPQGMEWLTRLSPLDHTVPDLVRVPLAVPDGLVGTSQKGPFRADAADGTSLWTWSVRNDPFGDGPFWLEALRSRIEAEFEAPEARTIGRWSCLSVDEPVEDDPYRWMVCMSPVGKRLHVASVYFPSPGARERHASAIEAVLAGGGA